jgi:hypothetical protein
MQETTDTHDCQQICLAIGCPDMGTGDPRQVDHELVEDLFRRLCGGALALPNPVDRFAALDEASVNATLAALQRRVKEERGAILDEMHQGEGAPDNAAIARVVGVSRQRVSQLRAAGEIARAQRHAATRSAAADQGTAELG